jgi:hypothetical protein
MSDAPIAQEEFLNDNPEFADAFAQANTGVYQHTVLQMWEDQLTNEMVGWNEPPTMDTYQSFMENWRWVGYHDVPKIRRILSKLTVETLNELEEAIEYATQDSKETKAEIYADPEHDWVANKDIYFEVIARFTALPNKWGTEWHFAPAKDQPNMHVAIAIIVNRIIGQQGLAEQMRHLKDFDVSEDEGNALNERVLEIIRSRGGVVPGDDVE